MEFGVFVDNDWWLGSGDSEEGCGPHVSWFFSGKDKWKMTVGCSLGILMEGDGQMGLPWLRWCFYWTKLDSGISQPLTMEAGINGSLTMIARG